MPVIENENATMFIVLHGLHHSRKIEFELSRHIIYYKSQCQQKAQGLQAVGPHIVRMPLLRVYSQISNTIPITVTTNGTSNTSNT